MADEAANPAATTTGTEAREAPADEQPGTALEPAAPRRPPSPSAGSDAAGRGPAAPDAGSST